MTREVIQIGHHGRTVYGIAEFPEGEGKWPIVIFCHGFNGTADDFAEYSEYLVSRGVATYRFDFCGGSVNSRSSMKTYEMSLFTEKEDRSPYWKTLRNGTALTQATYSCSD